MYGVNIMSEYGRNQYGRFKYGKYNLVSGSGELGPHVQYRIRTIATDSQPSEYLMMGFSRISIPSTQNTKVRIRANGADWVYTQSVVITGNPPKTRVRSIENDGGQSEWVQLDRANLRKI